MLAGSKVSGEDFRRGLTLTQAIIRRGLDQSEKRRGWRAITAQVSWF
jgi:hypothetical protein